VTAHSPAAFAFIGRKAIANSRMADGYLRENFMRGII
jgi:hypothetical protein